MRSHLAHHLTTKTRAASASTDAALPDASTRRLFAPADPAVFSRTRSLRVRRPQHTLAAPNRPTAFPRTAAGNLGRLPCHVGFHRRLAAYCPDVATGPSRSLAPDLARWLGPSTPDVEVVLSSDAPPVLPSSFCVRPMGFFPCPQRASLRGARSWTDRAPSCVLTWSLCLRAGASDLHHANNGGRISLRLGGAT